MALAQDPFQVFRNIGDYLINALTDIINGLLSYVEKDPLIGLAAIVILLLILGTGGALLDRYFPAKKDPDKHEKKLKQETENQGKDGFDEWNS